VKRFSIITLSAIIPTLLVWLIFFSNLKSFWSIPLPQKGLQTVISNYDGPLYIAVAKTFYQKPLIKSFYSFQLPNEYFAAHFPLYPTIIKIFSLVLSYPHAMLLATLLSSILALYFFNLIFSKLVNPKVALWATLTFAFFPARWLTVRSVGSPEPLFIATILASLFFFTEKKYFWAGVWGALAQLTKSPGVLLFVAYGLFFLTDKERFRNLNKYLPLLLIPISLLGLFVIYKINLGNFWAYFHSGNNIHLFFPPFTIFNASASWVGSFWLEDVIFVYLFYTAALIKLVDFVKNKDNNLKILPIFFAVFLTTIFFVAHRDISRYALPLAPLAFIAFADFLAHRYFKYVLALLAIPCFLFAISFISHNVMPIANWAPFL